MGMGKGRVCPLSPVRLSPFQKGRPPIPLGSSESFEAGVPFPLVPFLTGVPRERLSGVSGPGASLVPSRRTGAPAGAGTGSPGRRWWSVPPLPRVCLSETFSAKRWFAWRGRGQRGRGDSQTCPWVPVPRPRQTGGRFPRREESSSGLALASYPARSFYRYWFYFKPDIFYTLNQTYFIIPGYPGTGENPRELRPHLALVPSCFWRHLGAFCLASTSRQDPLSPAVGTTNRKGSMLAMPLPAQ